MSGIYKLLDRYGIQASSINVISSFNRQRKNRFAEKGTKEIPNQIMFSNVVQNVWFRVCQFNVITVVIGFPVTYVL